MSCQQSYGWAQCLHLSFRISYMDALDVCAVSAWPSQ